MKESVEQLLPMERGLFFALNGSDSVFLDNIMWTFTGRYVWILLFLFLIFMFFHKVSAKEGILATLMFVVLFVLCDQVSSSLIKPLFERLRPTHHPDFGNLVDTVNGYRGGRYGFVSGHATNSFGLAVFLSLLFRNRWVTVPVLVWAVINSYSRIYLGVHFISDIIGGAIVGWLIGLLVYELYVWIRYRFYKIPQMSKRESVYPFQSGKTTGLFITSYMLLIIIFSQFLATLPH